MESPVFLREFLNSRNLIYPDARPLYAYRCNMIEFEQINQNIYGVLSIAKLGGRPGPKSSALFCLFASVTLIQFIRGHPNSQFSRI